MQWFYDLKTIHKMVILISIMAIAIISVGYTGYYFANKTNNDMSSMYKDRLIPIAKLNESRAYIWKIKCNLFDAAVDKNERNFRINEINTTFKNLDKNITEYSKTKLDPEEVKILNKLVPYLADLENNIKDMTENIKNNNIKMFYKELFDHEKSIDIINQQLIKLSKVNTDIAMKINIQADKGAVLANNTIISIIIISLIFCSWLGFLTATRIAGILGKLSSKMNSVAGGDLTVTKLGRIEKSCIGDLCVVFDKMLTNLTNLVKEVANSAEDISASSEEMSASSEQTAQGSQQTANSTTQLAEGAQEISRNVEEGASNISKMNKIIQQVSEESKIVAQLGNNTETNANTGAEQVKKAVNKIDSIKKVSGDISVNIAELGDLSSDIEEIVDLIKNIAGQTNLLALNAAIEAARAGEHGKGFAVVADEVKKLAGQSAEATEKITTMIKEIQHKTQIAVSTMDKATQEVEEGVLVINDAGKALDNIIYQVRSANTKIQVITKEIEGVAKTSENMVQMIENISAITEETAASAEEISSITEEQTASLQEISASSQTLATIAERLTQQVSAFRI